MKKRNRESRPESSPNTTRTVPASGDLFERTFETSKGPVDLLAEVIVKGETLVLKNVVVYGRSSSKLSGLAREALAARTQLIEEARALGFKKLRLFGKRVQNSSSAHLGHPIDLEVDLTR